jgi:hypothetical protein
MLSAASHGTDQIIVQRLLATRSLRDARWALVGSGVLVIAQFALFLLLGTALWAAGLAGAGPERRPDLSALRRAAPARRPGRPGDGRHPGRGDEHHQFVHQRAGLVGDQRPVRQLDRPSRRPAPAARGALVLAAVGRAAHRRGAGLHVAASGRDTPVVVLALSIASVTYGALLGAYVLAGWRGRVAGVDVIRGAAVAVGVMLVVVFAARLATWPALALAGPGGAAGLSLVCADGHGADRDHGGIELAVHDGALQLVRQPGRQVDVDRLPPPLQPRQRQRQHAGDAGVHGPQLEQAAGGVALQCLAHALPVRKHLARPVRQGQAGVGQHRRPARAVEQPHAQLLLQGAHLHAHRRQRQADRLPGLGHAAAVGDRGQRVQGLDVHGPCTPAASLAPTSARRAGRRSRRSGAGPGASGRRRAWLCRH